MNRAVKPNLRPVQAAKQPMTVDAAAKSEDHIKLLVAMRDRIAAAVSDPECPPRDLSSLTRRLQDIARELSALKRQAEQDGGDSRGVDESWDQEAI